MVNRVESIFVMLAVEFAVVEWYLLPEIKEIQGVYMQKMMAMVVFVVLGMECFAEPYRNNVPPITRSTGIYSEKLDSVLIYQTGGDITKEVMLYDGAGNISSRKLFEWFENEWSLFEKREYTYDQSGNCTSMIFHELNSTYDSVVPKWRSDYTYDKSGYQIEVVNSATVNDQWEQKSREVKIPDSGGNDSIWISFNWKGGWLESMKTVYQYNSSNRMIGYTNFSFSMSENQWEERGKQSHRISDDRTRETVETLSRRDTGWVLDGKWENVYSSTGRLVTSTYYSLADASPYSRTDYEYDRDGNIVAIESGRFESGERITDGRELFIYDYTTPLSKIAVGSLLDVFGNVDINAKLTQSTHSYWDKASQSYLNNTDMNLYYSPFTQTPILETTLAKIIPLTATISGKTLTLSHSVPAGSSISLYDLSGRVVHSASVVGSSVAVPSLAKGIYIAEIMAGTSSLVQKIRVE